MPDTTDKKLNRRQFLGLLATAGLAPLAARLSRVWPQRTAPGSGPMPSLSSGEADSKHRWAMVIDQGTCIGCNYCTYGCLATPPRPSLTRTVTGRSLDSGTMRRMRSLSNCDTYMFPSGPKTAE